MLINLLFFLFAMFLAASIVFAIWSRNIRKKATIKAAPIENIPARQWTTEFLESKRRMTDPLADEVINTIMQKGEENSVNSLFGSITKDGDQIPADLPDEVRAYFEKTAILPDWADKDLIALGQNIYTRHGVLITILLAYKALPECYACPKGAMVLFHTARLNEQSGSLDAFSRRIAETSEFIYYAMKPGGLLPDGKGIRAAQKVRLIHAVVRYFLRQNEWDVSLYDEPINQEDLAGTLMSFSALILEGLETMGVDLSAEDKEAYTHCWRVIGHIMGVDDDIIPVNAADSIALGHAIQNHQIGASVQGNELIKALINFQNKHTPSFMDYEINVEMMRFLMGDTIADLLNVPPANKQDVERLANKVKGYVNIGEKLDHTRLLLLIIQGFNKILLEIQINQLDKGGVLNFYIPESLTKDWSVKSNEN